MKVGDIVSRKSYNYDIQFRVIDMKNENVIIQALKYRLIADADYNDLQIINTRVRNNSEIKNSTTNIFKNWYINLSGFNNNISNNVSNNEGNDINVVQKIYGKILHIDGDKSYLKECLLKYEKLGVPAIGIYIEESDQPKQILNLLKLYKPNILVITGHDSLVRGSNNLYDIELYQNSKYYIESVKIAREFNNNYDELVIFAGGCKSYYEALMKAGANFATSPNRVLVNVIDPVLVACKVATTSVREFLDIDTIVKNTSSGISGIGGIETRGQCREYEPGFL